MAKCTYAIPSTTSTVHERKQQHGHSQLILETQPAKTEPTPRFMFAQAVRETLARRQAHLRKLSMLLDVSVVSRASERLEDRQRTAKPLAVYGGASVVKQTLS
jgi:hypothetical protein